MAKERFLIVAVQAMDDCFGRFSESVNRDAIDAGTADPEDAYAVRRMTKAECKLDKKTRAWLKRAGRAPFHSHVRKKGKA